MSSYRPITDTWLLARTKVKRYGSYLGGFPERARSLLGCRIDEPVLHVCGGLAKQYPYRRGFGPNDRTLDMDPACDPDYLMDARDLWPPSPDYLMDARDLWPPSGLIIGRWAGILIDPPYSPEDAAHYSPGADKYPKPGVLLHRAFEVLPPGGRVGIIHYLIPRPPQDGIFVALVGVMCGFNNRMRAYSVFEKPSS